jgi:hypothetical protein
MARYEDEPRTLADVRERMAMPIQRDEIHRIAAFNRKQHAASMRATMKWADKLAQTDRKPLKPTTWWRGNPYGKPPESTATWANAIARKHPPVAFIYDPTPVKENPYKVDRPTPQDGGIRIRRAKTASAARKQLRKFGVPATDMAV